MSYPINYDLKLTPELKAAIYSILSHPFGFTWTVLALCAISEADVDIAYEPLPSTPATEASEPGT